MVNEKKIRLMTKAAMIEENNRRKLFISKKFYNGDFVFFQTIKAVIGVTVAFAIIVGIILMDGADALTTQYSVSDISVYLRALLFIYIGTIVITVIISIISCTEKYYKSKELMKEYSSVMKKLGRGYGVANKQKRSDGNE